jgi:hypothetical protein
MHSKNKGSEFERHVCKALSRWITGGGSSECFWRAALSGGRATVAMKRGDKAHPVSGDVAAVTPEGHVLTDSFHIECKHLYDLEVTSFLLKRTGKLAKFWDHTVKVAEHHGKKPMLIVRQNLYPTIVVMPINEMQPYWEALIARSRRGWDLGLFDSMVQLPFHRPLRRERL